MKNFILVGMSLLMLLALTMPVMAQKDKRLQYAVDASSADPPATVTTKSDGVTVVIFRVASIHEGDQFSFTLSVSAPSTKASYPVIVPLAAIGKGDLEVFIDPVNISLPSPNQWVSTHVSLMAISNKKKLKEHIKGLTDAGSHLGQASGVKVIITTQTSSTSEDPEEQILQDVVDALSPETAEKP